MKPFVSTCCAEELELDVETWSVEEMLVLSAAVVGVLIAFIVFFVCCLIVCCCTKKSHRYSSPRQDSPSSLEHSTTNSELSSTKALPTNYQYHFNLQGSPMKVGAFWQVSLSSMDTLDTDHTTFK